LRDRLAPLIAIPIPRTAKRERLPEHPGSLELDLSAAEMKEIDPSSGGASFRRRRRRNGIFWAAFSQRGEGVGLNGS
jgi:diketogulonate reductase-like aldo/keto reductase